MCAQFARGILLVVAGMMLLGGLCDSPLPPSVLIYGITPAEAKSGELVSIRGRLLDQANLVVKFCDLNMTTCYQAALVEQAPHFATVVVPSVPYDRTKYYAYVGSSGALGVETVAGKSRSIYLRGGGVPPTSQQLRIFVGSATWKFLCDADGKHCNEIPYAPYDYWYGCHYPWPSARSHASWTTHPWSRYRLLIDQAVRDWSTMCSRAWADPDHSKQLAASWIEAATREEWEYNWWFWLETARDKPIETCPNDGAHWSLCDVYLCDWRRAGCTGSGPLYQIASGKTYFCNEDGTRLNICGSSYDDCAYHGTPLEAVAIWFVGAFFYYGQEVDPNDPIEGFRAFAGTASPALVDTYAIGEAPGLDSHGLIFLSQSPSKGYFPHPATSANNVNPLLKAERTCTVETCWPGPGYSDDATPNVLAHELMHVLTNRRDPSQTASLEDTIWIQSDRDDGGIYRRGFSLRASALNATAQTECAEARAGDRKDFTE